MKKTIWLIALGILAIASSGLVSGRASAALEVDQSVLRVTIAPGGVTTSNFSVSAKDESADVTINVVGVGQTLEGSFYPVSPDQETNARSAISYVSVFPQQFHLEPNQSQFVDVTVALPGEIAQGAHYAMLEVVNERIGVTIEGVGTQEVIGTNLIVAVEGSSLDHSGEINSVAVGDVVSNRPIPVTVNVSNTGNTHYRVAARARLSDLSGHDFAVARTQLSQSSLMPGFSRDLTIDMIPNEFLPEGEYFIDLDFLGPDLLAIQSQRTTFALSRAASFDAVPEDPARTTIQIIAPPASQGGAAATPWIGLLGALVGALAVGMAALAIMLRRNATRSSVASQ